MRLETLAYISPASTVLGLNNPKQPNAAYTSMSTMGAMHAPVTDWRGAQGEYDTLGYVLRDTHCFLDGPRVKDM